MQNIEPAICVIELPAALSCERTSWMPHLSSGDMLTNVASISYAPGLSSTCSLSPTQIYVHQRAHIDPSWSTGDQAVVEKASIKVIYFSIAAWVLASPRHAIEATLVPLPYTPSPGMHTCFNSITSGRKLVC